MGSQYYNPGRVNIEEAERGILNAGGGKKVEHKNGYDHVVVYSTSSARHLSYDLYPDGHIENVHTDDHGRGYTTYGGAQ